MNEDYKCALPNTRKTWPRPGLDPAPRANVCVCVLVRGVKGETRLIYGRVYKFIWSSLIAA